MDIAACLILMRDFIMQQLQAINAESCWPGIFGVLLPLYPN
jgi:hypothetical protein